MAQADLPLQLLGRNAKSRNPTRTWDAFTALGTRSISRETCLYNCAEKLGCEARVAKGPSHIQGLT